MIIISRPWHSVPLSVYRVLGLFDAESSKISLKWPKGSEID